MEKQNPDRRETRRAFVSRLVMIPLLAASYGFFAALVVRFLYPGRRRKNSRPMFVAFADKAPPGASQAFTTPRGDRVILTNTGQFDAGKGHGYTAFSSRCPHLGCKVHYDAKAKSFICPCHQGVFDQGGVAVSGPPAQAGQSLSEYEVQLDGNSIYVMVEVS